MKRLLTRTPLYNLLCATSHSLTFCLPGEQEKHMECIAMTSTIDTKQLNRADIWTVYSSLYHIWNKIITKLLLFQDYLPIIFWSVTPKGTFAVSDHPHCLFFYYINENITHCVKYTAANEDSQDKSLRPLSFQSFGCTVH